MMLFILLAKRIALDTLYITIGLGVVISEKFFDHAIVHLLVLASVNMIRALRHIIYGFSLNRTSFRRFSVSAVFFSADY